MSDLESTGQAAPAESEAAKPESEQVKTETAKQETETPASDEKQAPAAEKTFTQKELDEILQKRLAKSEARAERRAKEAYREALEAVTRQQPARRPESNEPTRDQFDSDADWIDAKVEYKLQQREAAKVQESMRRAQTEMISKTEDLYAKAERLPGFDRDTFDELPLTKPIASALIESDVAPQLMAYMASNPDEVERIAKLSDARQAVELGKLELKLQNAPKTSKAPAPINPLSGAKGGATPDPERMTFAEYKAYREKQRPRWAR